MKTAAALFALLALCFAGIPAMAAETNIDRSTFSIRLPNSWKVDTAAPDFNADNNFAVVSERGTIVTFRIDPGAEDVDAVLTAALGSIDGPAITAKRKNSFTAWGSMQGSGKLLRGKILDCFDGEITVFVASLNGQTVLITETVYSDAKDADASGLAALRDGFRVKAVTAVAAVR